MNNINNSTICFVFSQNTLDVAIEEWVEINSQEKPELKESFEIAKAALPWFMHQMNPHGSIYMFSAIDMQKQIELWKSEQIAVYPKQQKRIEKTCDLLIEFFHSAVIEQHKMTVHT